MKTEGKNSKQQLAVLGVLAILFVGFVSFQIMGTGKGKKSAQSAAKTSSKATVNTNETASSDTADEASASNLVISPIEYPNLKQAVPRRDPFKSVQINMGETSPIANAKNTIIRVPKVNKLPMPNFNNMKLPPVNLNNPGGIQPINPFNQDAKSGVSVVKNEEKKQEFTLTGVIKGSQNIAILRSGEGSRIIAREGDMISEKYKLLNISQDSVILSSGNHIIRIPLGGVNNAG